MCTFAQLRVTGEIQSVIVPENSSAALEVIVKRDLFDLLILFILIKRHFKYFLVPGSAPEDFIVSGVTSRTISVAWSPPPPGSQRGIITHYVITYSGIERDSALRTFNVSFSVRNIELTGLEEFTQYSVFVAAATVLGSGPSSQLIPLTSEDGMLYIVTVF